MTTTPTPTGKIKGSFRDVTTKLRNFVGAVKITTPKGKGGILMDMGRPVAAYLTQDGVLHRGKASLDLLDQEPLAEFEILRYDDEQFREARIICDNRGLLIGGEQGGPAGAPSPGREAKAREQKPREEENLLSSMMKRFVLTKAPAKQATTRGVPKADTVKVPLPEVPPEGSQAMPPAEGLPVPKPPSTVERALLPSGKKEAAAGETDLSAIIKRLRESAKAEKTAPPPQLKTEEAKPKAAPLSLEKRLIPVEAPPTREERPAAVTEGGKLPTPPTGAEPEGRLKVDLGQMMKRIKRLDITSIREELEERVEEGAAGGGAETKVSPEPQAAIIAGQTAPPLGEGGKSDIDQLKAFMKKLEVLEEPKEVLPSEKSLLGRLGVKVPPEEASHQLAKKEVPPPIPRMEMPRVETPAVETPTAEISSRALEKPEEKPLMEEPLPANEMPGPAEPDQKAKIASLLRRSGLFKPAAEEKSKEIITGAPAEPKAPVEKEEAPVSATVPSEEPGIRAPPLQRKKVEITRVPKKPEKPLREPPLIDEKMIQKVLKQPGVIAVSTFYDGFAVQSAGRADFEQVAANAEDLFRMGTKIAREIAIGPLSQIILETGKGKLIIAPHGDLNVCILTEPDANLGLIRVAIKGMQLEKGQ